MTQWSSYDDLYKNFSQWLKDTEVSVRSEVNLQPDLPAKQSQHKRLKVQSL